MNEQANGYIKKRITAWMRESGQSTWDVALAEVAQVHNHTRHSAIKAKPFEVHFNCQSTLDPAARVPFAYRAHLRVENEFDNCDDTHYHIAQQAVEDARARGVPYEPHLVASSPAEAFQSLHEPRVSGLVFAELPDNAPMTPTPIGIGPPPQQPLPRQQPSQQIAPIEQPSIAELPTSPPSSPSQRPVVKRALKQSTHARHLMKLRHDRGKHVHVFEVGYVVTVKVPPIDQPGKGSPSRLYAKI